MALLPANISHFAYKGNSFTVHLPHVEGMTKPLSVRAKRATKKEQLLADDLQPSVTSDGAATTALFTGAQTAQMDSLWLEVLYGDTVEGAGYIQFVRSAEESDGVSINIPLVLDESPDLTIELTITDGGGGSGEIWANTFEQALTYAVGTEYKIIRVRVDESFENRPNTKYEYFGEEGELNYALS